MKWGDLVRSAGLTPRWLSDGPVTGQSYPQTSAEACPTAQTTNKTPLIDVLPLLERRAQRVSNRSRKQAARYMATHKALINSN